MFPAKHRFNVGNRVQIQGNTALVDGKGTKRPYFGLVAEIVGDGYLISPDNCTWIGHWYYFELTEPKIKSNEK